MDTLVLSTAYEPVGSTDWKTAMTLWTAGRVEILDHHGDRFIHSVLNKYPMPAVIRYLRGRSRRPGAIRYNRENVYLRDSGECQYCGVAMTKHESTYDHVVPRRVGGTAGWENIVLACRPCNQRKGGRTPEQAGMPLRRKPTRPRMVADSMRFLADEARVPAAWLAWLPLKAG